MCLTADQRATMRGLAERILPSDQSVGAEEAGLITYVDWVVRQPFFAHRVDQLIAGIEFLDSIANHLWQRPFRDCSSDEQDVAIRTLAELASPPCHRFLRCVINMTLAGFLCDPKYGGNLNKVGWTYIGFERRVVQICDRNG